MAHGQMNEDLLEKVIDGFWQRSFDVLVCTTIVETGLDISNANTLVVDHAEILGLSQMHQLRGRVGRGRERGYAYFLYPAEKPLTETAHDRLATIAQNSDLGSGMAVAMRDLEIRGAGSILGAEQIRPHRRRRIRPVRPAGRRGGDRLQEGGRSPASAGEEEEEEPLEVRVELPIDASIPHEYVPGERLRLDAYRKIAGATDEAGIESVRGELVDRYGPLPEEVENLLAMAAFRQRARTAGVGDVSLGAQGLKFSPVTLPDSGQLRLMRMFPGVKYRETSKVLTMRAPAESDRIGAEPLRDRALLAYCDRVLDALRPVPARA